MACEQGLGGPAVHQRSVLKHPDSIGELRDFRCGVGHKHHGLFAGPIVTEGRQRQQPGFPVERRQWLIQQQERGRRNQRPRQRDPMGLAARQGAALLVGNGAQTQLVNDLLDAGACGREACTPGGVLQVGGDTEVGEHAGALRHQRCASSVRRHPDPFILPGGRLPMHAPGDPANARNGM